MKKIIAPLLCLTMVLSLRACSLNKSKIVNTTSEVVDAVVYKTSVNTKWGYHYIYVAYGSAANQWYDEGLDLYEYYKNHLGETIKCYLVTHEYEDGSKKYSLVYNETLHKGIPEGELIHPEDYTFPEGVDE